MKVKALLVSAVLMVCAGCDPGSATQGTPALETLTCPTGQIAWNFSAKPVSVMTSEGVQQSPDASVPPPSPPITMKIDQVYCGTQAQSSVYTSQLADDCDGNTHCQVNLTCTQAQLLVDVHCSNEPDKQKRITLNPAMPGRFIGTLYCRQPEAPAQPATPKVLCVPEQCHGATRRDPDLQCVPDFERPTVPMVTGSGLGKWAMSVDIEGIGMRPLYNPEAAMPSLDNYRYYRRFHGAGVYETQGIKLNYNKPLNTGVGTKLRGRVVFWLGDTWEHKRFAEPAQTAFRCVVHSIELSKYNFSPTQDSGTLSLDGDKFVLPSDCTNDSYQLEQLMVPAGRVKSSVAGFLNNFTKSYTKLYASFDLENENIVIPEGQTRESACAANPVLFYSNLYSPATDLSYALVDNVAYFQQRSIPLRMTNNLSKPQNPDTVMVELPTRTEIGVSDAKTRGLELRVKNEGRLRGGIRVDVDWYLAHDRRGYWGKQGFSDQNKELVLRTWLVPKDANGNQVAAPTTGYTLLGEKKPSARRTDNGTVSKVDGLGTTESFRFPVTDALRRELLRTGSAIEVTNGSRVFELLSCMQIVDKTSRATSTSLTAGGFGVSIVSPSNPFKPMGFSDPGQGCRWSKTPLKIIIDKAIEPIEPLGEGDWSGESNPGESGSAGMSQELGNDAERNCDTNSAGTPRCNTATANDVRGEGLFGGTYASIDASGELDTGQPLDGKGEAEFLSFNVLEDDEEQPWKGPGQAVTIKLTPPWEDIREALSTTYKAPEWKTGRYAGQMGLGVGWGFKFPVFFGPVQLGVAIVSISLGFSLGLELSWTADSSYPCINMGGQCAAILEAKNFKDAMNKCYATGGRLGEFSTNTEAQKVTSALLGDAATDKIWLGAQVANDYGDSSCRTTWSSSICKVNHKSLLRWLTTDDEFGQSLSFGAVVFTAEAHFPGSTPAGPTPPSTSAPVPQGLMLTRSGLVELHNMTDTAKSVCVYDDAVSDNSHQFSASIPIGLAAGVGIAFCSPNDEFGLCLEGSVNFVDVGLTPSVTYSYHRLKDSMNRKSTRTNVNFSFDWELKILSGSIDVKAVFGPFEVSYNLFTFDGLRIPKSAAGGKFLDIDFPSVEAFK